MKFTVLTLFPDYILRVIDNSITGRALAEGIFELECLDIRDFAVNDYGQVDDALYGGGTGMLLRPEPVWDALKACGYIRESETGEIIYETGTTLYYLSPKGKVFDQKTAYDFAEQEHIILLCGHYEGIDERVLQAAKAVPISLGDFVLTGGEIAACAIMDAVARLLPGTLPDESAHREESHASGFLEEPQYTRPYDWRGYKVPDVLLSGHQANIDKFRQAGRLAETLRFRPDMLKDTAISAAEFRDLLEMTESD